MTTFETYQIAIGVAAVLVALFAASLAFIVGQNQNEINNRLLKLQDYVAISVVPNRDNIGVWNTGNSNLYMWGFDMPGNNQRFKREKLLSPSTVVSHWIPAPILGRVSTTVNFEFKIYLTDEYGNKWISENGGEASPTKIIENGKELEALSMNLWSYRTKKEDWQF